ncbi:hypothetical protein HY634_00810 [Candidatus Uhrbacteria bacterium]|nr:hypothetical protein [Candidatus Uhrbacteria bacterium]
MRVIVEAADSGGDSIGVNEAVLCSMSWGDQWRSNAVQISSRMFDLRTIDEEREERVHARMSDGRDAIARFEQIIRARCEPSGLLDIRRALSFASGVSYDHPGLSRGAYLAHPFRIAGWAMMLGDRPDVHIGTIALLHNLYEVSRVQHADIVQAFDTDVAEAIARLTVDRSRQHQDAYRRRYYRSLHGAGRRVCVVKVLDKLDNLFLLCLNPDAAVRAVYLQEIENFVVPLAVEYVKECVPYVRALVRRCRVDEHIPLDRFSLRLNVAATGTLL